MLWNSLADILGTAAAAALLRRATKGALSRCPELAGLSITREALEYRCTVPPAWEHPPSDLREMPPALRELSHELCVLLADLTGPVVVNRLADTPELRALGIVPQRAEEP